MAEKKQAAKSGTSSRQRLVRLQWKPTGYNRAAAREVAPYRWARGEIVEVDATWWAEHKERLLTSPREEWTVLTAAEAEEVQAEQEAQAVETPTEGEGEVQGELSNPTPAAGE